MLGRKQEVNLQLNQILDALLIALAFLLSHAIRFYGHDLFFAPFGRPAVPPLGDFLWVLALSAPFTPIVLEFQGYYHSPLQKTPLHSFRQIARTFLFVAFVIGACVVFFRWDPGSRFFLPLYALIAVLFLMVKEGIVRAHLLRRVRSEGLRERVIFAGTSEGVEQFLMSLPEEQRSLVSIVGKVDLAKQPIEELVQCMHDRAAERVIFSTVHVYMDKIEKAIHACEREGVEAWLAADFIQTSIARPSFDVFGGRPMLVFRTTPDFSWALVFKEIVDRCGAALLIAVTSPLWVFACLGIKKASPGPVLFRQMRSGRNGYPFPMLKFRTMDLDAESRREGLERDNKMTGPVFKIDEDPRIFSFGKLLRKTSIDELPQLWNVLMGQMSLVGPRPLPVYEIEKISDSAQRRRLSVKPGLTCLWQVSGRNQITNFEDWVALDLQYIDNWSIWLDFRILLRTIPAVLIGMGAR